VARIVGNDAIFGDADFDRGGRGGKRVLWEQRAANQHHHEHKMLQFHGVLPEGANMRAPPRAFQMKFDEPSIRAGASD
jgi:hypothetical protein